VAGRALDSAAGDEGGSKGMDMHVLIIGAAGMIGRKLTAALVRDGARLGGRSRG
jgi:NAD(P)-dependent dehydrogenase (short-subunit alcohol dehydrogenase family)